MYLGLFVFISNKNNSDVIVLVFHYFSTQVPLKPRRHRDLYSSPNITAVNKVRGDEMERWEEHQMDAEF